MVFPVVMYGCESWTVKKAESSEELMLLNCGVGEDLSKRKRRLDSLEAAQGAPRDPRRDSRGERSPWLPLEIPHLFAMK